MQTLSLLGGVFFLYPSFTYFIRNSSLSSWVFFFFALPYVPIFYRVYQRSHPSFTYSTAYISGIRRVFCFTHHSHILSALCVFYAACLVSTCTHIFYPAYQRCVPGESFMDGCLVSPIVQIFYPHFVSFTPGAWSHPTLKYFIQTLSLLRRVPCLTLHSDFLPRISECVPSDFFLDGCLVSPIVQIFYPHYLCLLRRVPGLTLHSHI